MKNQTDTIRKIVKELNQEDGIGGGFWLPNIQRNFVWREDQIERLFDSLMRDYPVGTLLVWKTKSKIKHRKFIDNYNPGVKFTDFYVPENEKCKLLVLDGQQRLQSLYIGLKGSHSGKELYFNVLSGVETPPEDVKYAFKFYRTPPDNKWIKLKDIVFGERDVYSDHENITKNINEDINEEDNKKIGINVSTVHKAFKTDERIVYQELDSVDEPELYSDNDVVEIFIRANSGGTPLGKSDLLFSLLTSSWDEAEERMDNLLEDLNKEGYLFTRDFILKTCLTLLNTGARYNVEKFRDENVKNEIIGKWTKIENSVKYVKDFLYGKTYLRSKKALKSYLPLIPLIYFHYHYKDKWQTAKYIDSYILRTLLSGAFSGNPDGLIDACIRAINDSEDFINRKIFSAIRANGRNLEISKEELLSQNYSKRNDLHLIFNVWYKNVNFNPSYSRNELNIDHIFPTSILRKIKLKNNTRRLRYKKEDRNKIGNLMLLTREENGPEGKSDKEPSRWFKDKDASYLKRHLIPEDPKLWEIENFDSFITEREKLIVKKFRKELGLLIKEKRKP